MLLISCIEHLLLSCCFLFSKTQPLKYMHTRDHPFCLNVEQSFVYGYFTPTCYIVHAHIKRQFMYMPLKHSTERDRRQNM